MRGAGCTIVTIGADWSKALRRVPRVRAPGPRPWYPPGVTSGLLAFFLLVAVVDPRLAEPLRLLADVRDARGEPVGAEYAELPRALSLTLRVAALPPRAGGHYNPRARTVTMAEALLSEDPRVLAVGLVHELRHATDLDQQALGLLSTDCLTWEARAFESQAIVARALWPEQLPDGTEWERGIAATVQLHEQGGITALRAWLEEGQAYQRMCAQRPA